MGQSASQPRGQRGRGKSCGDINPQNAPPAAGKSWLFPWISSLVHKVVGANGPANRTEEHSYNGTATLQRYRHELSISCDDTSVSAEEEDADADNRGTMGHPVYHASADEGYGYECGDSSEDSEDDMYYRGLKERRQLEQVQRFEYERTRRKQRSASSMTPTSPNRNREARRLQQLSNASMYVTTLEADPDLEDVWTGQPVSIENNDAIRQVKLCSRSIPIPSYRHVKVGGDSSDAVSTCYRKRREKGLLTFKSASSDHGNCMECRFCKKCVRDKHTLCAVHRKRRRIEYTDRNAKPLQLSSVFSRTNWAAEERLLAVELYVAFGPHYRRISQAMLMSKSSSEVRLYLRSDDSESLFLTSTTCSPELDWNDVLQQRQSNSVNRAPESPDAHHREMISRLVGSAKTSDKLLWSRLIDSSLLMDSYTICYERLISTRSSSIFDLVKPFSPEIGIRYSLITHFSVILQAVLQVIDENWSHWSGYMDEAVAGRDTVDVVTFLTENAPGTAAVVHPSKMAATLLLAFREMVIAVKDVLLYFAELEVDRLHKEFCSDADHPADLTTSVRRFQCCAEALQKRREEVLSVAQKQMREFVMNLVV